MRAKWEYSSYSPKISVSYQCYHAMGVFNVLFTWLLDILFTFDLPLSLELVHSPTRFPIELTISWNKWENDTFSLTWERDRNASAGPVQAIPVLRRTKPSAINPFWLRIGANIAQSDHCHWHATVADAGRSHIHRPQIRSRPQVHHFPRVHVPNCGHKIGHVHRCAEQNR